MGFRTFWIAVLAAASLAPGSPVSSQARRTERVRFDAGAGGTTVGGRITGYEAVDYRLGARAGQTMRVKMTAEGGQPCFNLMAPGEMEVAFFNGSVGGDEYTGTLPEDGDYTIRVYQMRSAARWGETAGYSLTVEITSPGPVVRGRPRADALVPGTEFNATGNIPCARAAGQPMGQCRFGVNRRGDGSGSVTVFWPGGGNRVLFFEDGTLKAFDRSEADGNAEMTVEKEVDLFLIRVGEQRFEIPEAVLVGG